MRIKELKNEINKLRTASKAKYPDLVYYYLALQYGLGFADSEMELAYTRHIGTEMMDAFKTVGNKYAINFLDSFWIVNHTFSKLLHILHEALKNITKNDFTTQKNDAILNIKDNPFD